MNHPTDRITHTTAFVSQWVHPMKDRSDDPSLHERTLLPRSYISLIHGWIWWLILRVLYSTCRICSSCKVTLFVRFEVWCTYNSEHWAPIMVYITSFTLDLTVQNFPFLKWSVFFRDYMWTSSAFRFIIFRYWRRWIYQSCKLGSS